MMGSSALHQALKSLCLDTGWNYAVFWKLKHGPQMMLTWEDAYNDSHGQNDPSRSVSFNDMVGNSVDENYSHDLLELTLAKMSYHVYSLGEGIVGNVAVTGKHMWICLDNHVFDNFFSYEHCDEWQTQLSAGVKTIAVVAIVPHGVVQLGSLNTFAEDLKMVNHIRNIFLERQSAIPEPASGVLPCSLDHSNVTDVSATQLQEPFVLAEMRKDIGTRGRTNCRSSMLPSLAKPTDCSYQEEFRRDYPSQLVEMVDYNQGYECSVPPASGNANLLPVTKTSHMEWQKNLRKGFVPDSKCERRSSKSSDGNLGVISSNKDIKVSSYNHISEFQKEINNVDMMKKSFSFPAGCELYEALGSAYHQHNSYCDWEMGGEQTQTGDRLPADGVSCSNLLTTESGSEHLLDAVVANVSLSSSDDRSAKSLSKSVQLPLTSEVLAAPYSDVQTSGSACYSFDHSSLVGENSLLSWTYSESSGVQPSQDFSSSQSRSERSERPHEPSKVNKKRARPGENSRPRPRDRQLIQDRLKELRELVPNGSKCSIDSLLERTIKHMLFMQCVTKHADKIDKCAESKLLDKKTYMQGSSSHEQGSSWAMEVGDHLKVCPIIVEDIGMSGQMLVEMTCEESIHFLEIAESIRNLGLTILKGVMEAYGDKNWMCFVVEGQNRNMHRTDLLWSLVQILQCKTNAQV